MKSTTTPRARRRPGRPSKLTTELRNQLLELVRKGVGSGRAARTLGISPDSISNWSRDFPDFSDALDEARDQSIAVLERRVHSASRRDWRAASWLLERRLPSEYGRRERVESTVGINFADVLRQLDERQALPMRPALPTPRTAVLDTLSASATASEVPITSTNDDFTRKWEVRH